MAKNAARNGSKNGKNAPYDIKDPKLAPEGKKRVDWAGRDMPVLNMIAERFRKEKPLKGAKMTACLHVTAETANLMRTLKAGGADVLLCASNPLSTQDDVAATLSLDDRIPTFAIRGEDSKTYYSHLTRGIEHEPNLTMDDGADLVSLLHTSMSQYAGRVIASMEETTTGVIRLKALEADGRLTIPVVAVNDADTKHLFDNRYGTGQSTIDAIIRATDVLMAGKVVVVVGYGWCGRGVAARAAGSGAQVVVCEVDPMRALEAAMDGFRVMPMAKAAKEGDIFVSVTGDMHTVNEKTFPLMKNGAVVCNAGHFDIEIDVKALTRMAKKINRNVRNNVDEYIIDGGKSIFLLAEGRLVNLAAAEGHPASVMDMSFATQALAAEWAYKQGAKGRLEVKVHKVPREIEEQVASLKLASMGIQCDKLTPAQKKYLTSWEHGTE
ncbi:MAG TPA: adenosylhomocysteinase [Candidatus Limnocylindrales bacterium]|nr:adenosylhomocysteinase [Candidatus Limnocylindrales bacterium]